MAAGTIYPDFPGKGAESGWYNLPGKGKRYWTGSEFRFSGEGQYDIVSHLGSKLGGQGGLSPEQQRRSDAQAAYNSGDRSQATLHTLYPKKYGPPGSGSGSSSTQQPSSGSELPTTAVTRTIAPSRDYQAEAQSQARSAGPSGSETRTNSNNVKQTGRNLSSLSNMGLAEASAFAGVPIARFDGPSFPTEPKTNKITAPFQAPEGYTSQYRGETGGVSLEGRGKQKPSGVAFQDSPDLGIADRNLITQTNKPGGPFSGAPQSTTGQQDPNTRAGEQGNIESSNESRSVSSEVLQGLDAGIAADGGTPPNRAGATLSQAPKSGRRSRRDRDPSARGGYDPRFDSKDEGGLEQFAGTDPASYAASNTEMRRRSTFLDGSTDSLLATRQVNAGLGGIATINGARVNVNGEMVDMNASDWRKYRNASEGDAQKFKEKWLADYRERTSKESVADEKAEDLQQPDVVADTEDKPGIDPEDRRVPGRQYGPGGGFG